MATPQANARTRSSADARSRLLERLPVVETTRQLAGISTAVLEGGEGPPIILLHGPNEYGAKWLRVIPDLAKSHRVIAPDLPGHGRSVVDDDLDADRVVLWLSELIDATCDEPPVLVGQILGGAIAARFACSHSDRIHKLVLVDSLGLASFEPDPSFGQVLMAFVEAPSEATHDRLWSKCAFDLDQMRRRMGDDWERVRSYNLDRASDPRLRSTQQSLMGQFGMAAIPQQELSRISVPTFLIWGRHDLATAVEVGERVADRHGWPLQVIESAGDDPPMEQPEAFVEALRSAVGKREEQPATKET